MASFLELADSVVKAKREREREKEKGCGLKEEKICEPSAAFFLFFSLPLHHTIPERKDERRRQ